MGEIKLTVDSPEIIQEIRSLKQEVLAMLEGIKSKLDNLALVAQSEAAQFQTALDRLTNKVEQETEGRVRAELQAEIDALGASFDVVSGAIAGIVPDEVETPVEPTPEVPAPSPEVPVEPSPEVSVETPEVVPGEVDVATDENGNPIE